MGETKLKWWIGVLCLIIVGPVIMGSVCADGGVIVPDFERVVYLPEQKAALFWDGINETMVLSTKIRSDNVSNMAWIVPVPSTTKPEVAQGDIEIFTEIAFEFGEWVGGDYYLSYDLCFLSLVVFVISLVGLLILLLKKEITFFYPLLAIFVLLFIISIGIGLFSFTNTMMGDSGEVFDYEVIEILKVDIYDVAILKATNATALVELSLIHI